jgi:hypothetical protein
MSANGLDYRDEFAHWNQHALAALTEQERHAIEPAVGQWGRARRARLIALRPGFDEPCDAPLLLTRAAVPARDHATFAVDMQRGSTIRAIGHDSCIGDRRVDLESVGRVGRASEGPAVRISILPGKLRADSREAPSQD